MRYTKKQFDTEFPDDDACLEAVFQDRFGRMKFCPSCGVIKAKFYRVKGRQCYACEWCSYQLFPLADTIFRKTTTPLKDWFYAIYLMSVSKNGVSAKELERHLGVTYKTAWRMLKQVRTLMSSTGLTLSGTVEIDETYVGGKGYNKKNYHVTDWDRKAVVFGAVERNGFAIAKHVKTNSVKALIPEIQSSIELGSQIYSDELRAYRGLPKLGYQHQAVNHSVAQYRFGDAYTNTIEGVWQQLKRTIYGTYHSVSKKHLQLYVDEVVFRYNYRAIAVGPVLLERALKPVL